MSGTLASFRELHCVGQATEARLHGAGLYTWEALSEVVDVLAKLRSSGGDAFRELAGQLAKRASGAGAASPRPPDGERSEAFVVRISLTETGRPIRSTVTHVRSQTEQPLAGWSPAAVIRLIEAQSGLAAAPRPATEHLVILDAGKTIGGARRDVELVMTTDQVADVAEFEYRATLAGRAYGPAVRSTAAWTTLAAHSGRARPPERLPVRFEAVEFPVGLQRLRLEVAMRLSSPRAEAPILALGEWSR